MFTPEVRSQLRSDLLQYAANDARINGAAITGSAAIDSKDSKDSKDAVGGEDRWSDIDLGFGVADAAQLPGVLSDWTTFMYKEHRAVHHVDIKSGSWIYRVFLLASTMQVDLAFVPATEFRALAPTFRLIFGKANEPRHIPPAQPADIIGLGWLYALHARSSIARAKLWQAEYMISGVRDHALALACIRHGLPEAHGRGIDQLPREVTAKFEASLVIRLESDEVSRAFRVAVEGLVGEIQLADQELGRRLEETLTRLSDTRAETPA